MIAPLALLLVAAAAPPRVAVVVHPIGFSDEDSHRVQDRVAQEVSATGVELWALSKSLEVRTECLVDRSCAHEVLRAADASWLVWVEATRAGGQVQLESHLLDKEGRPVKEDDSATRAEEIVGGGTILAPAITAQLKAAAQAAAAPPTTATTLTTATTPTTPTTPTTTSPAPLARQAAEAPATGPDALSPLAFGGIATIGAGALLVVGGGAIAAGQLGVIQDPASLGAQKQSAANVATAMMAVTGIGVAVAVAGGALLYLGL